MPPILGNGKICYIEIPTNDIPRSADFYSAVFNWNMRKRGDGATAFDDGVGQVSGTFVTNRAPSPTPGLLIYIMIDDIEATLDLIKSHGGQVTQPVGADAPELTARFADPSGNVLGLYQDRGRTVDLPKK